MDQCWKKKWVNGLRSDAVKQVTGVLQYGEHGFCAMGVLGKEMGLSNMKKKGNLDYDELHIVGLEADIQRAIIQLNDVHHVPFEMLAGLIDETL